MKNEIRTLIENSDEGKQIRNTPNYPERQGLYEAVEDELCELK